jgi:hypothetical protein
MPTAVAASDAANGWLATIPSIFPSAGVASFFDSSGASGSTVNLGIGPGRPPDSPTKSATSIAIAPSRRICVSIADPSGPTSPTPSAVTCWLRAWTWQEPVPPWSSQILFWVSPHSGGVSCIVATTYRYKGPPRKRKPVAIEVSPIVTKRSRRPLPEKQAAAQVSEDKSPRCKSEAARSLSGANDDRKSAIVTIKRKSRFGNAPDMTPEEHRRRGDAADALFGKVTGRDRS